MHAALMLPHQLVEAAGRDLLSFTRNSRIQSCGQRRLHFAPLLVSIWTSLRAPGLQPASKCLRPLLWALCSQLLPSCPQEEVEIGQHLRITRSEEHTSELQSHHDLVCRLLLEKKK